MMGNALKLQLNPLNWAQIARASDLDVEHGPTSNASL